MRLQVRLRLESVSAWGLSSVVLAQLEAGFGCYRCHAHAQRTRNRKRTEGKDKMD